MRDIINITIDKLTKKDPILLESLIKAHEQNKELESNCRDYTGKKAEPPRPLFLNWYQAGIFEPFIKENQEVIEELYRQIEILKTPPVNPILFYPKLTEFERKILENLDIY